MQNEWHKQRERGGVFVLKSTIFIVKFMPKFIIKAIVLIVTSIYYIFSPNQRRNLAIYHENLQRKFGTKSGSVYRNFYSFGDSIVDKMAVWLGKINMKDLVLQDEQEIKDRFVGTKRGCIVIVSHFGNIEVARALGNNENIRLAVLMYSKNSAKFAKTINEISKNRVEIFEVDELNVGVMMRLGDFLDSGGQICVMGDRTPIGSTKVCKINFLTKDCFFPQGGFVLASILKCDVCALWCVKTSGSYKIRLQHLASEVKRGQICKYVEKYVRLLELECQKAPHMWFNFYDYWGSRENL